MSPIPSPPTGWRERADRAVARGRRLDRFIPGALLDSRVSRVGYWYGCTVGWVWGSIWSTGRIEKRQGLWVFRGLPAWAFPRGGVCVGGCFLTGDDRPSDAVLRHEAVHKVQWRRYGFLMPVLYALAGRDPLRNRFEIEAGLIDGNYVPRGH
ncbi:Fe-S oxidoreductase [Microbacterium testaceum]|uniref:Fe-S oxidoreductase n=1 Tax=Microbacterium testaceum TaxID=2033 RepID=A0A2T7WER8_MICTE|nr:Fe-S oxidoreductase [Microbacterium testaceum]PVE69331.1 Fe-S oxidoreductase [Microbacterium testaceum]